jgi:hypothetical protein
LVTVPGGLAFFTAAEESRNCYGGYLSWPANIVLTSRNPSIADSQYVQEGQGQANGYSPGSTNLEGNPYWVDEYLDDGMDCYNFGHTRQTSEPVDVYNVEIQSPAADTRFDVTVIPTMPTVNANARIVGISPDPTSSTNFTWNASVAFSDVTGRSFPLNLSSQVVTGGSYTPNFQSSYAGGSLTLSACATVGSGPQACASRDLLIRGLDPTGGDVKAAIQAAAGGPDNDANQVACQESGMHQFRSDGLPVQSVTGAAGIFQIIFQRTREDYWNWRSNISSGMNILNSSRTFAQNFPQQVRTRVVRGRGPYPNATNFTLDQRELEAIHRYNNGTALDVGYWEWDDVARLWVANPQATAGGDRDFVAHVLSHTPFCRP